MFFHQLPWLFSRITSHVKLIAVPPLSPWWWSARCWPRWSISPWRWKRWPCRRRRALRLSGFFGSRWPLKSPASWNISENIVVLLVISWQLLLVCWQLCWQVCFWWLMDTYGSLWIIGNDLWKYLDLKKVKMSWWFETSWMNPEVRIWFQHCFLNVGVLHKLGISQLLDGLFHGKSHL